MPSLESGPRLSPRGAGRCLRTPIDLATSAGLSVGGRLKASRALERAPPCAERIGHGPYETATEGVTPLADPPSTQWLQPSIRARSILISDHAEEDRIPSPTTPPSQSDERRAAASVCGF